MVERPRADRADIVVVGAGIAGVGAAWALADGHRVVLIEQEAQPGTHATGRSAAVISETSGPYEVCALAARSRPFLTAPPPAVTSLPLLAPRGLLWVDDRPWAERLEEIAAVAARLGVTHQRLEPEAIVRLAPELRPTWVSAGLYEPQAMSIDVAELLSGWLADFKRRGGHLSTTSEAVELSPLASGWRVVTPEREIHCNVVVNAAGAWADEVAERAGLQRLGLQPLRRTAFVFPGPGGVDLRSRPLVMDVGSRFYFEPEGPGLLASPADETLSPPTDARPDEIDVARAVDALAEATTIEVRGVSRSWAGLRTFATDCRPVVGFDPTADGFFWLAGQGGAGIKTAPALAELTRSLIVDGPPSGESSPAGTPAIDPATISPARFRP
jgi:D-arginine dehydrogenase